MRGIYGWIVAAALLGCERQESQEVRTQSVPKQSVPASMPSAPPAASAMPPLPGAAADPEAEKALAFVTPAGWTKQPPKSMRVVSFSVDGGAEMIASKFPMFPGSLLENVNRWRRQTGLPPTQSEADTPTTPSSVGGVPSKRFQIDGPDQRMILLWAEHDGTWFFKLLGPTAAVDRQAANFEQFLQSVKFQ